MHDPGFHSNPHHYFRELHMRTPLARSRRGIEVLSNTWNVELYGDRRLETPDVQDFVAKGVPPAFKAFLENGFLLGFHAERHNLVRRVIQKGFTIRKVDQERDLMRAVAHELIDDLSQGNADFVADYTIKFPVISICRMLGVPEQDIPEFKEAAMALHLMGAVPIAPGFSVIEKNLLILHDYVARLVAKRRHSAQDDFISALIEAERVEGALTQEELVWNIANLLFAGQDTTRFQLAGIVRAAIDEPGHAWAKLRAAPALVKKIMWEGMRFYPAVQWSSRKVVETFEFRGFQFQKGQWVFLNNLAASRDPASFQNPDVYDIARAETFAVPFGRGLHHCVGQMLARTGMEESLKILSQRLPDMRIDGPVHTVKPTAMVGGPESMPVRFTVNGA